MSIDPRVDIGHVHLKVSDIDRSLGFYRDILGFDVMQRMDDQAAFLSAGGYHHHVGLNVWAAQEPIATAADAGLDDWSLLLPTGEAEAALRVRAGAVRVTLQPDGNAIVAKDPWGITVRVRFPQGSTP